MTMEGQVMQFQKASTEFGSWVEAASSLVDFQRHPSLAGSTWEYGCWERANLAAAA
jgi:hypothetical protein